MDKDSADKGVRVGGVESVQIVSFSVQGTGHRPQFTYLIFAKTGVIAAYYIAECGVEYVPVLASSVCTQALLNDFLFLETVDVESFDSRGLRKICKEAILCAVSVVPAVIVYIGYVRGHIIRDEQLYCADCNRINTYEYQKLLHNNGVRGLDYYLWVLFL